jgi:heat-inducible transcriptional repressor
VVEASKAAESEQPESDPVGLDERKAAILKAVVTDYVETSVPVGSVQIAHEAAIDVSPATVRADMAALEREGYLSQPHTSAGRIPTDKGYRFFVDHLAPLLPLDPAREEQVQEFFSRAHGEIERLLGATSRLLADLTDTAAIVVPPSHERDIVRSAILTRLSRETALLVVVLSDGAVERRMVAVEESSADEDLRMTSNFLDQHFTGHSLEEMKPGRMEVPTSGEPVIDSLIARARDSLDDATAPSAASEQVFVDGASRMIEHFHAVEQARSVLTILEQSFVVVSLISEVLTKHKNVSIGSENGIAPLAECSLVVAPFGGEGGSVGTIGILGPTRMDYPRALATVAVVGQRLSSQLEHG